jgi:hypothetical protein
MKAPAGVGERFAPMLTRDLRAGTRETIDAGP